MKKLIVSIVIILIGIFHSNAQNRKKVLFLGNSYTASNSLPSLINTAANSVGDTIDYDSNTPGGHRFLNHAVNTTTLNKISSDNWDYVVLQAQSQEPSWSDFQVNAEVFPYATILADSIKSNNECSMPLFFMTWGRENGDASNCSAWPPVCTYEGMDSILAQNYKLMADDNDAIVSPVGAVWNYIRTNWPAMALYSADGSHPSQMGSYAAACCFYSVIFEKDPTLLTYNYTLNQADADSIKVAAKRIAFDNLANWNIEAYDPVADFSSTTNNLSANFTETSTNAVSYLWNFGDGNTSTTASPNHLYANCGNYNACLIVTDNCGKTDSICNIISVGCANPISQFSYTASNLEVEFTNTSTNYDSLLWDFGNGVTDTAENQNISFDSVGTYTICLYTYNSCGTDTNCQLLDITCPLPVSDFSYSQDPNNLLIFTFTANTQLEDSISWSFGNGTSSTDLIPTVIYNGVGTYVISLVSFNDCGTDLYTDTIILSNSSTGISETKDCEIELFTTRSTIQLLSSNYCPSDDYILEIYDLSGRIVKTGKVNSSSTLNTTDLNTGIYIYQVRGSEKVYSGKVVVSN